MHSISVEEAKDKLTVLLKEVLSGGEVILTQDDQPIAKLVSIGSPKPRRQFGSARHLISIAPDFDEPLADFEEYRA